MSERNDLQGVSLPAGETGSKFFHRVLGETATLFSSELGKAHADRGGGASKSGYGDALCRFEAARIASPRRVDIARSMARSTLASLRLGGRSLLEALGDTVVAPAVERRVYEGGPGFRAEVPFEGRVYQGLGVLDLVEELYAAHHMTRAARDGLRWIVTLIDDSGGTLDLRGHRFAMLGANAELSPARMLLRAGATVLWIDVVPPPVDDATLRGTVEFHPGGDDVLVGPGSVLAAVRRFAEGGPVHLGLLAYAAGASRELRIAGAMAAIAEQLDPALLRSVAMLVSPTSPGEIQPEDFERITHRASHVSLWQRTLCAAKVLPAPGYYGNGTAAVSRAIVSLQGQGYQAAQYLTKLAWAESFASQRSIVMSANVAGITNTRSLSHPLFQVAFVGAPTFGIRIFTPETTRSLSGLLMLHDVLNPDGPCSATRPVTSPNEKARALRSQQIHGGVYAIPWQFDAAVRVAAVLGAAKRPGLLFSRLARRQDSLAQASFALEGTSPFCAHERRCHRGAPSGSGSPNQAERASRRP